MVASSIRIGLIGAGANTRERHIPGFQAIPGVDVVAVVNRSRESSERVAKEFGIPKIYDHWRQVIEADDIDAICIGTWPYMHCPMVLAALEAGKHVLTEARMAMNLDEAKQMLAASKAHPNLVTQIVPSPFTFPVDKAIQQRMADGFVGQLLAIDMRVSPPGFINREAPLHWRHDRNLSGLNVMTMGIWYESILRWSPGVSAVMARARTFVPLRKDPETGEPRPATVPDHLEVIGDISGGATFHLQLSSVTGLASPPEFWIYGTEGTLRFENASKSLSGGRRGDKALSPIDIPPEQRYDWRVEQEFIGAIRGEEPVTRTNFTDGVRYMAFTEAVARSAAENKLVPLLV